MLLRHLEDSRERGLNDESYVDFCSKEDFLHIHSVIETVITDGTIPRLIQENFMKRTTESAVELITEQEAQCVSQRLLTNIADRMRLPGFLLCRSIAELIPTLKLRLDTPIGYKMMTLVAVDPDIHWAQDRGRRFVDVMCQQAHPPKMPAIIVSLFRDAGIEVQAMPRPDMSQQDNPSGNDVPLAGPAHPPELQYPY